MMGVVVSSGINDSVCLRLQVQDFKRRTWGYAGALGEHILIKPLCHRALGVRVLDGHVDRGEFAQATVDSVGGWRVMPIYWVKYRHRFWIPGRSANGTLCRVSDMIVKVRKCKLF